jgi:hypothetical protein
VLAEEATWLATRLGGLDAGSLSPLLNVGSGDAAFRERVQPYIAREVFAPLAARGVAVVHADRKPHPGVDVVADIFSDEGLARLAATAPRAVLCSNVHEHVREPAELSRRLVALLPAGGHLLVTVPYSYPYHEDPFDTLLRPSVAELAELHAGTALVEGAVVTGGTWRESLRAAPWRVFGDLVETVAAVVRTRSARHVRPRWWGRKYAVSCVLLRKA